MNASGEELVELIEFKSSAARDKSRRLNRVDLSPSITSVNTISENEDANIVNIFSVTPRTYSKRPSSSDRRTISEISDDVFLTRPSCSKHDQKKSYKDKISEHIRKIKERTVTTSTGLGKGKIPVDRIRKESQNIDAEIENVRSKFTRDIYRQDHGFFAYVEEVEQDKEKTENVDLTCYALPEKLDFTVHIAEKECYFTVKRRKFVDQTCNEDIPKISANDKNKLIQRFTAVDDRKWFDAENNLLLLNDPVASHSLRPSSFATNPPNVTNYFPPNFQQDELQEVLIVKESIVNIYLSRLKFAHHPLFSAEHVFAQILTTACEDYNNTEEKNTDHRYNLEELRRKRAMLKDDKSIAKMDKDIKKARKRYFDDCKRRKKMLLKILETWKTVKKIRLLQNNCNTNVRLLIKKEAVDVENDRQHFKDMFKTTLDELKRENKIKKNKEQHSDEEMTDSSRNRNNEQDCHNSEDNSKSEDSDDQKLQLNLQKTFKECFKTPEEPGIKLSLAFDNPISEDVKNSAEASRRAAVSSTKFYLRILCNNIEACKTKFLSLTEDFALDIDETFSLQLADIPEFVVVEVHAQPKSLLKKKVCEMDVHLPNAKSVRIIARKMFEKSEIVHYKHEGVGSGMKLKTVTEKIDLRLNNIENYELKTSGYLEYSMEWEKIDIIEPGTDVQMKLSELDDIMDEHFVVDRGKIKCLIDSRDEIVHDLDLISSRGDYFRLNPPKNSLTFCHVSEIEQNVRLTILQLRDRKEIEFDGILVPNRLKEIPFNILSQYSKRKATEDKVRWTENEDDDDNEREYKSQFNLGKKHLKQVHLRIFQLCKNTENNLDYESVVNEKYFIYFHNVIKILVRNFFNWFRWRPKISKPLPILQKTDTEAARVTFETNLSVSINVMSSKNLPIRKKWTFNSENNEPENQVRPYVEASYKNVFSRTSSSRGSNADWNEILTLPLESMHSDYLNPNSLEGALNINVFDESNIVIKKLEKKCANWLGGIDIPLSAICCSDVMTGHFQLKIPHVLLDYEREAESTQNKSTQSSNYHSTRTYLHLQISIEPNVPKLTPNMEELPSSDIPYIQEHVLKWNRSYNASYPSRKFNASVLNTNGKTTCVTRYIKPLEPPQINNEEFDVTIEQCSRYISLIPFTECNHFYSNIWLSADQLINFMVGSMTDHAIALTCYALALKREAWLLLGYGIPHGNAAYVLIRDQSADDSLPAHYIIDVVYNEKYSLSDEYCPLQRIFCVINGTNVWANTQSTDNVALTRLEFNRHSDWLPLFDVNVFAPNSFMTNKIAYKIKGDTDMIEMLLEKQLKRKFSKVRQLDRTIWNIGLSSVLANVLKTFEINCMYNKNHRETLTELNQEISQYTVSGVAFNVPFKNISELAKTIRKIGLQIQEENDTEFCLAVCVQSYPGRVLSVWVFLLNIKNID